MKRYEEGASKIVADDHLRELNPIWLLPHHPVYHPRKPNEPRIGLIIQAHSSESFYASQLMK